MKNIGMPEKSFKDQDNSPLCLDLKKALGESTNATFRNLCKDFEVNPWDMAHRMNMTKIKIKKTPQKNLSDKR